MPVECYLTLIANKQVKLGCEMMDKVVKVSHSEWRKYKQLLFLMGKCLLLLAMMMFLLARKL